MTENSSKGSRSPYHRLTVRGVLRDYREGLLTPKGAIFYAISASRPPGHPVKISIPRFYEQFPISKTAYYRAISELKLSSRIDFVAHGSMSLWVPTSNEKGIPDYIVLGELSQMGDSESQMGDSESQMGDKKSQIWDEKSQMGDEKSQIWDFDPPKLAPDKLSGGPSTNTANTTNTDLSLCLSSTGERERERETDCIDPDFRKWLTGKAARLPQPPEFIEQWLEAQASKASNLKEFEAYQAAREMAKVPPPPPPAQNLAAAPDTEQRPFRLATLRRWWSEGNQARVERVIAEHPQWAIAIEEVAGA